MEPVTSNRRLTFNRNLTSVFINELDASDMLDPKVN